jgi:hypothetical protein
MDSIRGNETGRKCATNAGAAPVGVGHNRGPPLERLSYRANEVCAITGLSRSKVFQLIASGLLPSRLISGCRIITRRDLERFLQGEEAAE